MLQGEPSLDEILAEPIVRLLMEADRVSAVDLRHLLDTVRSERLTGNRGRGAAKAPAPRRHEGP